MSSYIFFFLLVLRSSIKDYFYLGSKVDLILLVALMFLLWRWYPIFVPWPWCNSFLFLSWTHPSPLLRPFFLFRNMEWTFFNLFGSFKYGHASFIKVFLVKYNMLIMMLISLMKDFTNDDVVGQVHLNHHEGLLKNLVIKIGINGD
jgi:hypothetical protein